jgi:hypothetical protein
VRRRADDSPFKKVDLKNAFANYALHFSLSAFYFVVGCQRDFLFGLVVVAAHRRDLYSFRVLLGLQAWIARLFSLA